MTDLPRAAQEVPVPRSISAIAGCHQITSFNFSVRTLLDYDATFLSDRIVSEIFINGIKAGPYSAMRIEESPRNEWERRDVIARYAPEMERGLIDEFMGLGYRRRVRELEDSLAALQMHVNRVRWWQVKRRLAHRKAQRDLAAEARWCES